MINFLKIIKEEVRVFDKKFKNALSTKASLLHKVSTYVTDNPGKKIRPICVILSSGLVENITSKTYRGAILIELLHTATLIHDDIVDDAHLRRSRLSINTIWKNKISVLAGDYFLAKGLSLSVASKDFDILTVISEVVGKIVEGELIQIEKTKKLDLNEDDYFNIIKLKTGSLFESAFKIGAISADANKDSIKKLTSLGLIIGVLFQIKDDILDYYSHTGKMIGNDLKEGKINLPLLHALNKMNAEEKHKTYKFLRKKTNTLEERGWIKQVVINYKGIEYAESIIHNNYCEAVDIVNNFEDNKYRNSILELLSFLINRKK